MSLNSKPLKHPYLLINLILSGIIILIFVYSAVFSASTDNYPLPSFYEEITGEKSPSSGLSKSFSEIIRGNLESANRFNENGIRVFFFFIAQLLMRVSASLVLLSGIIKIKRLVLIDTSLSVLLLLCCFKGFLGLLL